MNLLSVRELPLPSGGVVRLKICLGSLEMFADLTGQDTIEGALAQLADMGKLDQDNKPLPLKISSLKALRLLLFTAAKYVCLVEKKPVDFSEIEASEWVQAIIVNPDLMASIFDDLSFGLEPGEQKDDKKKG